VTNHEFTRQRDQHGTTLEGKENASRWSALSGSNWESTLESGAYWSSC